MRCTACGFTYYYNPAAATAALILNDRNELLVCRRAHDPARGTLDLPGGFCDVGETAEEGVAREVAEETGLRVVRADYLFSLPNRYVFSGFVVATVDLFFRCRRNCCGCHSVHSGLRRLVWNRFARASGGFWMEWSRGGAGLACLMRYLQFYGKK